MFKNEIIRDHSDSDHMKIRKILPLEIDLKVFPKVT